MELSGLPIAAMLHVSSAGLYLTFNLEPGYLDLKLYCDNSDKNHPDFYLKAYVSPVPLSSLFLLVQPFVHQFAQGKRWFGFFKDLEAKTIHCNSQSTSGLYADACVYIKSPLLIHRVFLFRDPRGYQNSEDVQVTYMK